MFRPHAEDVANLAAERAIAGKITYTQQDCQAFVEQCVIDLGGKMNFKGSNDMFRNAVPFVRPLPKGGKAPADLAKGALLFIVKYDGKEGAKYKADGLGNASHVGIYCGVPGCEVAHSSETKGGVAPSTLKNAWNYYGFADCMNFGATVGGDVEMEQSEDQDEILLEEVEIPAPVAPANPADLINDLGKLGVKRNPRKGEAVVYSENGGNIRLRKRMQYSNDTVICSMAPGDIVKVVEQYAGRGEGVLWSRVQYKSLQGMPHEGFVVAEFLRFGV